MPRVGISPSEQTSGGSSFSIPEGNHEIIDSIITNHAVPGYDASCGYAITVQPWRQDWTAPTSEEPITEFLSCGPLTKFHPGKGSGSSDTSPELEYGASLDLGEAEDVAGNTLLSATGAGPDKKSKASIMADSFSKAGIKDSLLNGYGPNLIGMKAHFTRFLMQKPEKSTAKEPPTCLVVGFSGKLGGPECVKAYPGSSNGNGAGPVQQAGPAPVVATAAPRRPRAVPVPVQGAAPPPLPPPPPPPVAPVSAPAPSPDADRIYWEAKTAELAGKTDPAEVAALLLDTFNDTAAGQSFPAVRFASKCITLFPKSGVTDKTLMTAVQGLIKDEAWLVAQAKAFGWEFDPASKILKVVV